MQQGMPTSNPSGSAELVSSLCQIAHDATKVCGASVAFVGLLNSEKSDFDLLVSNRFHGKEIRAITVINSPLFDAVRQGTTVLVPEISAVPPSCRLGAGTKSLACIPLSKATGITGAVQVEWQKPGPVDQTALPILEALANAASTHIRNWQIQEKLSGSSRELAIFQEVMRSIALGHDPDTVMADVLSYLYQALEFYFITISLVDWVNETISTRHGIWEGTLDKYPDWVSLVHYPLSATDIQADIVRTGRSEVISGSDPRFNKEIYDNFGHRDLTRAFVPIKSKRKVLGTIEAGRLISKKVPITYMDVQTLESFASQIGVALENAEAIRTAEAKTVAKETRSMLEAIAGVFVHRMNRAAGTVTVIVSRIRQDLKSLPGLSPRIMEGLSMVEDHLSVLTEMADLLRSAPYFKSKQVSDVDVEEVLRASLDDSNLPANIAVVKELNGALPRVRLDKRMLREMLLTVFDNARQAMGVGGGMLRVSTRLLEGGAQVSICIQDTGPGISETIKERLLKQPFVTTKDERSMGVGLFMAALYIRSLGGDMQIASDKKTIGAKVEILVPTHSG